MKQYSSIALRRAASTASDAAWGCLITAIDELDHLRLETERLRAREARLLDVLRGLVECCEYTRDSAFYDKSKYVNSVSKSAWSSFCLQVRAARATLAEQDEKI